MDRILKMFVLLFGLGLLSACGDTPYVSERATLDSGASIQTAVTGGGMQGTEETLVGVTDATGAESLMVRSGYGLGRELVLATVPGVVNTLTGGVVAGVLQGGGCGNSCGNTYNIAGGTGGTAVSQAEASSESGVTFTSTTPCLYPVLPDGSCPAMPVH